MTAERVELLSENSSMIVGSYRDASEQISEHMCLVASSVASNDNMGAQRVETVALSQPRVCGESCALPPDMEQCRNDMSTRLNVVLNTCVDSLRTQVHRLELAGGRIEQVGENVNTLAGSPEIYRDIEQEFDSLVGSSVASNDVMGAQRVETVSPGRSRVCGESCALPHDVESCRNDISTNLNVVLNTSVDSLRTQVHRLEGAGDRMEQVGESVSTLAGSPEIYRDIEQESDSDSPPSLATTEPESESVDNDSGHSDTWTFTPSVVEAMRMRLKVKKGKGMGAADREGGLNKVSYGFSEDLNSWLSDSDSNESVSYDTGLSDSDTTSNNEQGRYACARAVDGTYIH